MPPFQYILSAPTSPAVKTHEETLTYLNQGQSYEIRMLNRKLVEYTDISSKCVKSIVRVVFHDRRLQYTEHQQLEGWRWSRPGDRILDIDIPLSVGILEPRAHPLQLNTIEFLWDPVKSASVFIQCSPWPDTPSVNSTSSTPSPVYHSSPSSYSITDGNCSPNPQGELFLPSCSDHLLPSSNPQDTQQWLHRHRFSPFCRLFSSFSGADLLKMAKEDFIQICGPADGIRLFNAVKGRCIQPRLTVYVSQQQAARNPQQTKPAGGDVYHALYLEDLTVVELTEKISNLYRISPQQISQVYRKGRNGIHVLVSDEMKTVMVTVLS
ncbi:hypothetical protein JZ751_029420 [Albula glossodonta]|uniref:Grh/CP2 DB domain-containing protein n=1 Tax=Albula glossodonta TaxID=121402 RepID=A0A8T2PAV5_9TELE|nr:hypothetical protein JZ751_029420 [Albula glossodonta]